MAKIQFNSIKLKENEFYYSFFYSVFCNVLLTVFCKVIKNEPP
jgi:hypothetical protein